MKRSWWRRTGLLWRTDEACAEIKRSPDFGAPFTRRKQKDRKRPEKENLNLSVILVTSTKADLRESLVLKLSVVSKKEYIACPLSPSANMNLLPNKLKKDSRFRQQSCINPCF